MNIPLIIGLIAGGILLLIILILSGSKNLKKKASEKAAQIKYLDGRVNIDKIESGLRKMSLNKWDEYINEIKEKFELIDSLNVYESKIENYNEAISALEKLPLTSVQSNVLRVRNQMLRHNLLLEKYGTEVGKKLIDGKYFLGMTEEQLKDCKGEPTKIEQEVLKTKTKLIYIYGNKSSGDIFTFVNGELERFVDR